jgi:prephenate dehydrogenase
MIHFDNVTIIGVGLIGGSLAKALKAQKLARTVTGAGRSRETLALALSLGVIDRVATSPVEAVTDADLVVLAAPVGTFDQVVREIAPSLKRGAILTDVGSVKGGLVAKIESLVPQDAHYVAGHPIAGKETHGVAEASEALFRGAKCILTPTDKTDRKALDIIRGIWAAAGAVIIEMEPETHDKVFAAVSHLPHAAAYAMVNTVSGLHTGSEEYLRFSGAGFRDFTRIAASSPEMWRDICLLNGENIAQMIERYQFHLNKIRKAVIARDGAKLMEYFTEASTARRAL